MEIRQATLDDLEQVKDLKLQAKACEARYNTSLRPLEDNRERYVCYLRSDLASEDRAVFVATDRDKGVGIITGRIHTTLPIRVHRRQGNISNLFVASQYRGRGLAAELVRELLRWFRGNGIEDVYLGVHCGNASALKMFRELGFQDYLIELKKDIGSDPESPPSA